MAKFTRAPMPITGPRSPLTTTGLTLTHEGGAGYARDAKSDLLIFAAVNMVGEDTFYESAADRDSRFRDLVWEVTRQDPEWVARFVPYLRKELNMRSASVVVAAEYALCLRSGDASTRPGVLRTGVSEAPSVKGVIFDALQRPDEPGEFVAYWFTRTGKRSLPAGVQRGVGAALDRLYTERNVIKYDGTGQPWRLGDVVELVHAKTGDRPVLEYLLDRRHHADAIRVDMDRLPMLKANREFLALPPAEQRAKVLADPDVLAQAGVTWEILSSSGAMDKAAWEAVIPQMQVMALTRNLRNFDQAGVSDKVAQKVMAKLTSAEDVAKSRMFPYQFLSAFRSVSSLRWGPALETAVGLSTANIPVLPGRTLVLIDTSGSMGATVSGKSRVRRDEIAALFGYSLAARTGGQVDVVAFASSSYRADMPKGGSVLRAVEKMMSENGRVGLGTEMVDALRKHFNGHDRVVIFTDMQAFNDYRGSVSESVPAHVPMFGVNLAGYGPTALDLSKPRRFEIAGYSDKMFTMIKMLEVDRQSTDWPF